MKAGDGESIKIDQNGIERPDDQGFCEPSPTAWVEFKLMDGAQGWQAPPPAPRLESALEEASRTYFGAEPMYMGEGGSIPFMNLLSRHYPEAQFVITGVLGPNANAHGPNEFLHLPTARKLTACVAHILSAVSMPETVG